MDLESFKDRSVKPSMGSKSMLISFPTRERQAIAAQKGHMECPQMTQSMMSCLLIVDDCAVGVVGGVFRACTTENT
jgi:hypothetical protein